MSTLHEAARRVVAAWDDPVGAKDFCVAMDAFRAALAEPNAEYERGFIDGMQKQAQSSVDKAVNRIGEPVQAQEPVSVDQLVMPLVESALQAVAEKIGDQCAVWYGIGARDVEAVLREAARYGLVRTAQTEPAQEPVAWAHPTQGFVRWRTETIQPEVVASYERAGWTPLSLYTASQPQRPLTDEEIAEVYLEWDAAPRRGMTDFARAIERKVRGEA